jgi:hypothetical protein
VITLLGRVTSVVVMLSVQEVSVLICVIVTDDGIGAMTVVVLDNVMGLGGT